MEDIEHIEKEMKLIGADGQRLDGRRFDELRPIRIEAGVLRRADGSPYIEWGGEKGPPAGYGARGAAPRPPPETPRAPLPSPNKTAAVHPPHPHTPRAP